MRIFGAAPAETTDLPRNASSPTGSRATSRSGTIRQNAAKYAGCESVPVDQARCGIVLKGPREFADQYGADEPRCLAQARGHVGKIELRPPPLTCRTGPTFDSKMAVAGRSAPGIRAEVRAIADLLRSDWQRAIAFERYLSYRLPRCTARLEGGRRRLLLRVLTQDSSDPWSAIRGPRSWPSRL